MLDSLLEFLTDKFLPIITIFFGAIFLIAIVFLIVDLATSKIHYEDGVVIEKVYKPEENSGGFGTGLSSSGKIVTTYQTHYEPEKYIIIVRTDEGTISCETKANKWSMLTNGEKVKIKMVNGGWIGILFNREI